MMDSKQFAQQMIVDIQAQEAAGNSTLLCSGLVAYLNHHINSVPAQDPETEKQNHKYFMQNWIEQQNRDHEASIEMFRSVIESGQSALKTGFLLNGGAAVAMLAYIGQHGGDKTPILANGLLCFVWGTILITLCTAFTYFTQRAYGAGHQEKWWCKILNFITISFGLSAFLPFVLGMYKVYGVFVAN